MLFGARRDLQRKLVREGYKVRANVRVVSLLYAPPGRMPANMLYLKRNFFRS
jgi:hypothetical protein